MYETFYGFREKPFSLLPDPAFLYLSRIHSAALAMLQYGLSHQTGITVITGDVGSGKTTLIRELLNEITDDLNVGLISNTHNAFGELIQWVLMTFGIPYKGMEKIEMYETFTNFIIEQYARKKSTVLIIDEAQNMEQETLEELRLLSNINADKNQVLQLILVGQPELRKKLSSPELIQFAQRIGSEYYLKALDLKETQNYIKHRLKVAEGDTALFNPLATATIYYYSKGIPRLINTLCDLALVYAYSDEITEIGKGLIQEVASEKLESGLLPIRAKLR
ncbi:MAG TPA: DUF2075 domain-containing protein [Gammaproteobacteria bacterium]|nr:DUF2075 domain-containing protein [Gammaproteobacteria bacterium]